MKLSAMERDVSEGGPCGAGSLHPKTSSQISTSPQIRRSVRQQMKASNATEVQEENLLPGQEDMSKCDIGDEAISVSSPVSEDANAKPKDKRKRASKAPMTYTKRRKAKRLAAEGKSSSSHQLPLAMSTVIAASAIPTGLDPMDITDTEDAPGEHPTAPTDDHPKESRGQKIPGRGKQMGQKLNLAFRELVDEDSASIPEGSMASDNTDQPDNIFEPPSKQSPTRSVFRGHSQPMSSSDYAAIQLTTDHEATPTAFQQQSSSFRTNGSQEPFYTAYTDHFIPSSESTPESQRPLLATQSSTEETGSGPKIHKPMPRKSIVDQNGSPRLLPQEDMYLEQDPGMVDSGSQAGYILPPCDEADMTDAWGNFQSLPPTQSMCTSHREISLNYHPLDCAKKETGKRLTKSTLFGPPRYLKWPPKASRPARNDDGNQVGPEEAPAIGPEPMTPVPNYRRGNAASMSASSLLQEESSPHDQMIEWMASLQEAQRVVTELMLETNESITHQLKEEREAIAFVLDEYHEESLWALDRLFQTQQARMGLYRESLTTLLQQHADLCMRLVWRLQGEE